MKDWALKIAVVAGLVGVALLLRGRDRAPQLPETPESVEPVEDRQWSDAAATVQDFFDAASRGDDRAYLRLVSGQLQRSLEQTRSEIGAEAFRQELRRSTLGMKGLATAPGGQAPSGMTAVDVEIVFVDRTEHQRMLLVPQGAGWGITTIGEARMVKPPVPYGTPVFEEAVGATAGQEPPGQE